MYRSASVLLLSLVGAVPALAAPPASSSMGSGKVSMQDMHFSTRAAAEAQCDKSAITAAADGSFTCPAPASSDMAINEKGLPGTKTKPASKPQ